MWSIAKQLNTTVDQLKQLNNLSGNLLTVGQVLKVPTGVPEQPTGDYKIYIVQSGDSLYQIANRYNTTVDEIKAKNNLTSNTLSIGQTLIL